MGFLTLTNRGIIMGFFRNIPEYLGKTAIKYMLQSTLGLENSPNLWQKYEPVSFKICN